MSDKLREALQGLVDRLDEISADPEFRSVWTLHMVHVGNYRGPNWVDALERARAALALEGEVEGPVRVKMSVAHPIVTIEGEKGMTERFLGLARLKNEGEPLRVDEGNDYGNYVPRGAGQPRRDEDAEGPWYVVRDMGCSYDIDDDEAAVWTLSRSLDETGWETDRAVAATG